MPLIPRVSDNRAHDIATLFIFVGAIALLLTVCGNPPNTRFSPSETRGQAPFSVTFTNHSEGAVAYVWDFGDGSTSTEESPSHTYTQAGSHTVTLTATGEGDSPATDVTAQTITVAPGPLSEFTLSATEIRVPAGGSYAFAVEPLDEFGNAISDLIATFQTVDLVGDVDGEGRFTAGTLAGRYNSAITVVVTQGEIRRTATVDVVIDLGPLDRVVVSPPQARVPIGSSQAFSAVGFDEFNNVVPGLIPAWEAIGGNGAVDQDGLFKAGTVAGEFGVQATMTDGTGVRSSLASVEIPPDPLRIVQIAPRQLALEVGSTHAFELKALDRYGNDVPNPEVV